MSSNLNSVSPESLQVPARVASILKDNLQTESERVLHGALVLSIVEGTLMNASLRKKEEMLQFSARTSGDVCGNKSLIIKFSVTILITLALGIITGYGWSYILRPR